ncbi:DMT family transporter [Frigidibacter oleivorans]|uniref:DMT family transporter n=1 Tax=Frigidibacter oleivorans TaxID=2487129 RepID=UPI001F2EA3B6|nr:DMT family transporter [Frigidibacter oleivorans]
MKTVGGPAPARGQRPLLGALWMLGALAGFSAMAVTGRSASAELDTFEILVWRSLIGLVLVDAVALATGQAAALRPERLRLHAARNAAHFFGQNCWLYAVATIPLAQVFALEFTYPILVALLAPLLLGEVFRPRVLVFAAVGFAGILLVARPSPSGGFDPGQVAALLAAFGFAGSAIATKRLTAGTSLTAILHWLCLMQLAMALACAGGDGDIALPGPATVLPVVVLSVAGLLAHLCLTVALSLAPASMMTPIDFLRLPLIAVIGMLLYDEALDPFVFLGGAMIFGANSLNLWLDRRDRRGSPALAP